MLPRGVTRSTTLTLTAILWTLLPVTRGAAQDRLSEDRFRLVGTQGCTAANCHNLPPGEDRPILDYPGGSEYGIWLHKDKHARAFTVLFNQQSKEIAARLGLKSAATAKVCLACHATLSPGEIANWPDEVSREETTAERRAQLRDGVSCEACHGAAEAWLAPHKTPGWRGAHNLEQLGFVDNRKVEERAARCVECHVGGPGRDVDHDLIAAGHPRLTFELAAYHRLYTRHWPENLTGTQPELWTVGQTAAAVAALHQLQLRAASQGATADLRQVKPLTKWVKSSHAQLELPGPAQTPWPEFAELSCFACHHDLQQPSWRQARLQGSPGYAEWGSWTFALLPALARTQGNPSLADGLEDLGRMVNDPAVQRDDVARLAQSLRESAAVFKANPQTLSPGWLTTPESLRVAEWDHAAQVVLALEALHPQQGESVAETRRALWYTRTRQSKFNSPRDFGQMNGPLTLEQFEARRAEWNRQLQSRTAP